MIEELTGCGRNPCYVRQVPKGQLAMQAFCNCSRDKLIARIRELEAAQRWISVSERLPEEIGAIIFVWDADGLEAISLEWIGSFGWEYTHWMPMPVSVTDTFT